MTDPTPTPPVHEAAQRRDWPAYFDRIEGKPPRETLLRALKAFGEISASDDKPLALDLGCGSGRDVQLILEHGWKVWAQDGSADGIDRAKARPAVAQALERGDATLNQMDFQGLKLPKAKLVNASFSLPFCPPDHFEALWSEIDAAIEPGGRFSGQFFGDRDSWAIIEDRTHMTRVQLLERFDQYILEYFQEEDRPSAHDGEAHKHWHVFHIVARKQTGASDAGTTHTGSTNQS